jgi:hypothetical protein
VRGVKGIAPKWRAPTMMMSATVPDLKILRAFYPQAQVVADINVSTPHMMTTQILGAPVAAKKLSNSERNRVAVRRLILQRWLDTGRQACLVIAQKAYADWLRGTLPSNIAVEHFNAIAGLDGYREVRHLITIGRTQPGPDALEPYAGALTGIEPALAEFTPNGSRWYRRKTRSIRMPAGRVHPVETDEHPDSLVEAVRQQVCESELVQAVGRARGVNRTDRNPVDVTVAADVCLPLTVHQVIAWTSPTAAVEMAAAGIMLFSPTDMVKCWPEVWANDKAANRTIADKGGLEATARNFAWVKSAESEHSDKTLVDILTRDLSLSSPIFPYSLPRAAIVLYQPAGRGQKPRLGLVDLAVVPDPAGWLAERLGQLARCEVFAMSPGIAEAAE